MKDARETVQPHAGVDRGLRKQFSGAVRGLLELHEDQVPEFHVAIAGGVSTGLEDRAIHDLVDLGTGATGSGVAHLPEVLLVGELEDPFRGQTDLVAPEFVGLVVLLVHRNHEILGIETHHPGEEVPAVADCFLLEIVAKGEVPEHLEEGLVIG